MRTSSTILTCIAALYLSAQVAGAYTPPSWNTADSTDTGKIESKESTRSTHASSDSTIQKTQSTRLNDIINTTPVEYRNVTINGTKYSQVNVEYGKDEDGKEALMVITFQKNDSTIIQTIFDTNVDGIADYASTSSYKSFFGALSNALGGTGKEPRKPSPEIQLVYQNVLSYVRQMNSQK
jgi:hypothetical protein